ncbi:uncharacterized protein LOC110856126 isoform X2 [Folsomia candida]|uniref:uncharacterized protein LOC110856126 isoform X2 n=1 Tax=Folsomia candida TaxID=158441 RepID=UPI001604A56B|nr:uncharacterized protein LOC110856126 isoform X2 [Folsomia candida]
MYERMRVESCGPLFAQSADTNINLGDIFFSSNHRLSEPIAIINPKKNLLVGENEEEEDLLKLDNLRVTSTNRLHPIEHPLPPVGFFLTDEEWSLIDKQPDLESGEAEKMSDHLPMKPYSPLSDTCANFNNLGKQQLLMPNCYNNPQPFGSPSSTVTTNEDDDSNNNNVILPKSSSSSSFSQLEGPELCTNTNYVQDDDVQECKEYDPIFVRPLSPDEYDDTMPFNPNPTSVQCSSFFPSYNTSTLAEEDEQYNQNFEISWNIGGSSVAIGEVYVIESHYPPISSVSTEHGHTHVQQSPHSCHHPNCEQQQEFFVPSDNLLNDGECTHDYFEDWQSQSIFLSTEVDKAKLKWNQNQNGGNSKPPAFGGNQCSESFQQQHHHQASIGGRKDEMSSFLSKFDDKVAAIWGGGGHIEAQAFPSYATGGYNISAECKPVSCNNNVYPWASPSVTAEEQIGSHYYDIQNQIDQQERQLATLNNFGDDDNDDDDGSSSFQGYDPQQQMLSFSYHDASIHKPICFTHPFDLVVDPDGIIYPNGRNSVIDSMIKHFGFPPQPPTATEEDSNTIHSHEIVDDDPESSSYCGAAAAAEENDTSLRQLNHSEFSGFKPYIPGVNGKSSSVPGLNGSGGPVVKDPADAAEISAVQEFFGSLDLEGGDNVGDFDLEVHELLKAKPKTFYEQHFPPANLLYSWTTHFTPIDVIEQISNYKYSSPPGILPPGHENNPNLPEYYTLFAGAEKEYNLFHRPAKTLFPIRFKLCPQPEKAVQTESKDLLPSGNEDTTTIQQHESHRPLTGFDWGSYGYNEDLLSISSGSRTPFEFKPNSTFLDTENNNNNDVVQATDWFLDDSNYGIGIDASSRAGFYEDVYSGEYGEGEYDFCSGGDGAVGFNEGAGAGVVLQPYSTMNNDVDYGQFQTFSYNTWSTSTTSGKAGKSSRRRTKGKPCKYFLVDGSCKRGLNCKFSHDLTTCRYWAEGSCHKGDACPYMHCFFERNNFNYQDEKRRQENRYHLQSENDFPALDGSFGCSTLSSREQTSIINNPQQQADSGSSAVECHLMLADPAGSMYDNFGYGLPPSAAESHGFFMPMEQPQQQRVVKKVPPPPGKNELKRSGSNNHNHGRQIGKLQTEQQGSSSSSSSYNWPSNRHGNNKGSNNSNNNNWISSMISVKEKRKKKKQQKQESMV